MSVHHEVIKHNVCPADQTNLDIWLRLEHEFSREHGWVPRCSENTFGVVEWSIALRGMITLRKGVNSKRKMGQCTTPTSEPLEPLMFQTAVRSCRHSRTLGRAL